MSRKNKKLVNETWSIAIAIPLICAIVAPYLKLRRFRILEVMVTVVATECVTNGHTEIRSCSKMTRAGQKSFFRTEEETLYIPSE